MKQPHLSILLLLAFGLGLCAACGDNGTQGNPTTENPGDGPSSPCPDMEGGLCPEADPCAENNGGCGEPTLFRCESDTAGEAQCTFLDPCEADHGGCGAPAFITCEASPEGEVSCVDVDECAESNGGCGDEEFWLCINVQAAPPTCVDINECDTSNGGCGDPALWDCINEAGGPPTCAYDWFSDWILLTDGVETIEFGNGYPSSLIVHGPMAFSVVTDQDNRTVVAAARVDDGKSLHVGHEMQIGGALLGEGDAAQLLRNAVAWMSGKSSGAVIGTRGSMAGVSQVLAEAGHTVQVSGLETLDELDVFVTQTYNPLTEDEIDALQTFVREGGGVISGGHAWYWSYENDNAAEKHPANLMFWDFGYTLTGATGATGTAAVGPAPPGDLRHAGRALALLTDHLTDLAPLSLEDQLTAVDTVGHAVSQLPLTFETYYQQIEAFLELNDAVVPTTQFPLIPADQPPQHLIAQITSRFAQDLPAEEITAHEAGHDFPGHVADDVVRVTRTLTIDGDYGGRSAKYHYSNPGSPVWRSTGVYAAPGDQVTVTIPAPAADQGLSVLIGSHTDKLWQKESIERFPQITRVYPLSAAQTTVANAFGGLIYVRVPEGSALGSVEVTLDGVVPAPHFIYGETENADWIESIRHYPAPFAELESDRLVITVPSSFATTLDAPDQIMAFWNDVLDASADLELSPHERERPERFTMDRQISLGWMHSGYPLMGHITGTMDLLDVDTILANGSWGPFHELGHNHQWADWVLPGTTESTCNLWSVYVSEEVCGVPRDVAHPALSLEERAARIDAYVTGGLDFEGAWSVWTALETYLQLQEKFGWILFQNLFLEYRGLSDQSAPYGEQERIDQWVLRSSLTAEMNLVPFYQAWGFPISDGMEADLVGLPVWEDHPMATQSAGGAQ